MARSTYLGTSTVDLNGEHATYNVIDSNVIDQPATYGVQVSTYSTYSTTNVVIANNILIGATATINGTVNGVSSQNVTGT